MWPELGYPALNVGVVVMSVWVAVADPHGSFEAAKLSRPTIHVYFTLFFWLNSRFSRKSPTYSPY
jgi:hypothetical protein